MMWYDMDGTRWYSLSYVEMLQLPNGYNVHKGLGSTKWKVTNEQRKLQYVHMQRWKEMQGEREKVFYVNMIGGGENFIEL